MYINNYNYLSFIVLFSLDRHYTRWVSGNNFVIVFTGRQANDSTQALARASISYSPCSDLHFPLDCILNIINNDMN